MRSLLAWKLWIGLAVGMLAGASVFAQELAALPEGDTGLAAKYPADVGIDQDAAFIFAHDFEDAANADDLRRKWDTVFHDQTIRMSSEPVNVYSGRKAIEFTFRQTGEAVGNGLMKHLTPEHEVVFLRYYQKFEKDLSVAGAGSFHNGGSISAHYHRNGSSTAGVPADGGNKFLANYECTVYSDAPSPGNLTVYVYHPEQRGDYGDIFFPTGIVQPNTSLKRDWGPGFVARPDVKPELDKWHCYELMVKANTVGKRDGRIACWLDGKLIGDFPNLRLRDVDTLKIDYVNIGGYVNPSKARTNKIWFDDVVAAKSYIGPRFEKK